VLMPDLSQAGKHLKGSLLLWTTACLCLASALNAPVSIWLLGGVFHCNLYVFCGFCTSCYGIATRMVSAFSGRPVVAC